MTAFANVALAAQIDGLTYASAVSLTSSEADLGTPAGGLYGQALLAVVDFAVTGAPATNSTYVVAQTDLDVGTWIDLAWCLWTGITGTASFVLSGGTSGANAFQQSRASGTAPSSSAAIQCPLGGRLRFVGKTVLTGGTVPAVTATVKYKLLGLR